MVAPGVDRAPGKALPPAPPTLNTTKEHLAKLRVAPSTGLRGYSRERFGGDWANTGRGCDTRERVLIRDGRNVTVGRGYRPRSGRWRSIYDGKVTRRASMVDVDHVVPLAEAWRSGARSWSTARRTRLANDLKGSELVAVSQVSNRSRATRILASGGRRAARRGASTLAGGST